MSEDFPSLAQRFFATAYRQIVENGGVVFAARGAEIRALLLRELPKGDPRKTLKAFYELAGGQPFRWPLHERCVQLCKAHQVYPHAYYYLTRAPKAPATVEEALSMLTVPQLKAVLKTQGLPTDGKREVLAQRVVAHCSLGQLQPEFMPALATARAKWQTSAVKMQYDLLERMVTFRAYFLQRMEQIVELQRSPFKRVPYLGERDEADEILARLLDGDGYKGVIKNGCVEKLLPLFPGDSAVILTERVRRGK